MVVVDMFSWIPKKKKEKLRLQTQEANILPQKYYTIVSQNLEFRNWKFCQ